MALSAHQLADIEKIAPVVLAKELLIPVPKVFHTVLPGAGLQRGWATKVTGSASGRVFAWALLSEVTRSGGWIAAVDVPGVSLSAASEVGLSIERVVVVSGVDAKNWAATMGALIGSVDAVVYGTPRHRVQPSTHRKLTSRCRERGTVLLQLACGQTGRTKETAPNDVDVAFDVHPVRWHGLGSGHGRLESRAINVSVSGRRAQGRTRSGLFMVPDVDGSVCAMSNTADMASARETADMASAREPAETSNPVLSIVS